MWWEQNRAKLTQLNAEFYSFNHQQIQALAGLVDRTTDMSLTISGESAYITTERGNCEVILQRLGH